VRYAIALAVLFAAVPAQACHHFSVWRYPTPQRCEGSVKHHVRPGQRHVEITKPPPDLWSLPPKQRWEEEEKGNQ
jgi:hypothetical protein